MGPDVPVALPRSVTQSAGREAVRPLPCFTAQLDICSARLIASIKYTKSFRMGHAEPAHKILSRVGGTSTGVWLCRVVTW